MVRIGPAEVDTTDPGDLKTIYNSKETFKKSGFYERLTAVRAPVLFSLTDVATHRRLRRLMSTPISASSLKSHFSLIQSRVDIYIAQMKAEMVTRGAVDIYKWNMFLATDVVGELSFGESFRTLEHGEVCAFALRGCTIRHANPCAIFIEESVCTSGGEHRATWCY